MSSFDSWSLSPTNYKHGTLFTPQSTILACLRTSVFNQWLLDFIIITIINIGLCLLSVFHVLCSTLLLLLLQIIIIVHRPHSCSIYSTLHWALDKKVVNLSTPQQANLVLAWILLWKHTLVILWIGYSYSYFDTWSTLFSAGKEIIMICLFQFCMTNVLFSWVIRA